jgi:hypothetical protein
LLLLLVEATSATVFSNDNDVEGNRHASSLASNRCMHTDEKQERDRETMEKNN